MRTKGTLASAGFVATLLVTGGASPAADAADAPDPAKVGAWSAPFEEGGTSARCVDDGDGELICKPPAVTSVLLPDGRVLYWNGIEGSENIENGIVPEGGRTGRDSQARVLDLRGAVPTWTDVGRGGATNPNIDDEADPSGQLGVPGRPGDGLVGSALGDDGNHPTDPPNDSYANDGDMFCTDQVHLADGSVLIAGGTDWYSEPGLPEDAPGGTGGLGVAELEGLRNARIFIPAKDPSEQDRFVQAGHMKYGRWYPATIELPDGDVFVASGVTKLIKSTQGSQVRRTETFDVQTNTWNENYVDAASENTLPLFPRLALMPNGKIFYGGVGQTFGPMGQAVDEALWGLQQFFDPATKQWEVIGPAQFGARGGAFSVMLPMTPPYTSSTLLVGGGTVGPTPGNVAALPITETVTVKTDGAVTSERTGDLNNPRWFSSAVALPDGTVAAFSGADKDEVVSPGFERPVREAEQYDPATGTWTRLAPGGRDRTYHNTAVLLPDMRVLVGGHSPIVAGYGSHSDVAPGVTANNDKDASLELYSPPYLFRGDRPHITSAPAGIAWGSTFDIGIGDTPADQIDSVMLMRLPALTHIVDGNQRTLKLHKEAIDGGLRLTTPPDGIAAPPGPYYLVINKKTDDGSVPSVARIVLVGDHADASQAVEPMPDHAASGGGASEPDDTSRLAGAGIPATPAAILRRVLPSLRFLAW